jgi:hypothetical protein
MTYPITDIIRDAQGSLKYAVMTLQAPEHSRMASAARDLSEVERILSKLVDALEGYETWTGALAIAGGMTPDAWVELDKLHHKACSALNQAKGA